MLFVEHLWNSLELSHRKNNLPIKIGIGRMGMVLELKHIRDGKGPVWCKVTSEAGTGWVKADAVDRL